MHVLRVGAALALAALPDLHHEFASRRVLHDHVVADARRRRLGPAGTAADPDEVVFVDEDAVFTAGPWRTVRRCAPALHELAALIEFEHWRSGTCPLRFRNRLWHVQHPDVILLVDGD